MFRRAYERAVLGRKHDDGVRRVRHAHGINGDRDANDRIKCDAAYTGAFFQREKNQRDRHEPEQRMVRKRVRKTQAQRRKACARESAPGAGNTREKFDRAGDAQSKHQKVRTENTAQKQKDTPSGAKP